MKNTNLIGGSIGAALSVIGTVLQTSEILQIISLVITIVGAVISMIVLPLLNWYKNAKRDGKITFDEFIEGVDTLQEGIDEITTLADKEKTKKED